MRATSFAFRLSTCLLGLAVAALPAAADPVDVLVDFDAAAGELPEGLAVDHKGNVYATLALASEVVALAPDGTLSSVALLPPPGAGFLVGVAVDRRAKGLVVCLASFDPETHGVWRVGLDGSTALMASMPVDTLPNVPAYDPRGTLYVSDSFGGAVYRVTEGLAEVWFQDPLLLGGPPAPPLPFSVGANGLAWRGHALYVANTLQGRIVRVPILKGGQAGAAEVVAEDPLLFGADGIAFDVKGDLYVAVNALNHLARVAADGSVDVAIGADAGLYSPASVAFGRGPGERRTLYVTNFAFFGGLPQLVSQPAPWPGQIVP